MAKKKTYNVHEAKTNLSRLLQQVADGEEVVIAKAGEPVARLVPIAQNRVPELGFAKGQIWIADDFDAPLPDWLQKMFEGG
jgi:prevent-host-death family protein